MEGSSGNPECAAEQRAAPDGGPDEERNGLALCVLHHKLFDKGVLGVTQDWTITVSSTFVGRSPAARDQVLSLARRPAYRPQALYPTPKPEHIAWHTRQVFRAPARRPEAERPEAAGIGVGA